MTDRTVAITPGSGDQVAFDDNAQQVKLEWGAEGVHTKVADASGKRLPVNLAEINVTVPVSGTFWQATQPVSGTFWQATQPISAAALPLPSGAATAAKQPALGTAGSASSDVITVQGIASMTALKVDGSAVTQPVSDGGGSLTVDGTVAVTDGGGSITVDAASLPLPTGAATAAKQPALGTAGSASADVLTVQGIASMTALKVDGSAVTQPVSGTFWQATQPVSGTVTVQDGGGSITVDGTFWQATQPVSIAATVTVDSELPAAQSIAGTGLSVVNAPPVGAVMLTYNGTTWDSVQTGAGDGVTSVGKVPGAQYVFNGSTYDRARTITATMDQAATGIVAAGLVAQLDDVSTQTVTENQVGVVRMSSRRALLVEGVASGTNINTNIAQINGVTPLMGNGASGTGAQRVTIANDSTGILAGVTGAAAVAHDAVGTGVKPLLVGGYASAAAPSDVSADGDAVRAWRLRNGAAAVVLTAAGNLMTAGAGAVAAGTPRVTLASDDPAVTALANPTSVARLLSAAASTNATNVKNGAGRVFTIIGVNNAGAARFLKLYNKASSPTVGTDTPVATFQLPALQSFAIDIPRGLTFATGISYALTTAAADADTGALTAGDVTCLNIMYS